MTRPHRYSAEMRLCLVIHGRAYHSPKTAAVAIARRIAEALASKFIDHPKNIKPTGNPYSRNLSWRQLEIKFEKKAYRRVKPIMVRTWSILGNV